MLNFGQDRVGRLSKVANDAFLTALLDYVIIC